MGGNKKLFCICLCCGKVIKHTIESCRFVRCLECQKEGKLELLELSKFRSNFDEMMIREGEIGLI